MTQRRLNLRFASARRRRTQRGFAMALVMLSLLFLMACILVGFLGASDGSIEMADNGEQMAGAHASSITALTLAESGADYARLWFTVQPSPPDNPTSFPPFTNSSGQPEWGATLSGGTPTRATIDYPDSSHTFSVIAYPSASNPGTNVKSYMIESIGVCNATQVVLQTVIEVTSFAKYAYFDNNDHTNSGGTNWWNYPVTFMGPYHSNNSNGQSLGFGWSNDDATTMFEADESDSFSFSGVPVWGGPGTSAADFASLTTGGTANMAYGWQTNPDGSIKVDGDGNPLPNSARIPLPTATYAPAYAALGLAVPSTPSTPPSSAPTAAGVTLGPNGGIYVHVDTNPSTGLPDDIDTMTFSALPDSSGNSTIQQIVIIQPVASGSSTISQEQMVTVNPGADTTTVQTSTDGGNTWSTTATEVGTTNGVIYCDGNIGGQTNSSTGVISGGISGTIADNALSGGGSTIVHNNCWSVSTDIGNSKNIYIAGALTYNTARNASIPETQDSNFLTKAGTMGLVGNLVYIPNNTGTVNNGTANLEIDATIFAADTFEDQDPTYDEFGLTSSNVNLTVVGGLIENNVSYLELGGGYIEHYNYDCRMATLPPPYFPTTGSTYTTLSWKTVAQPLE